MALSLMVFLYYFFYEPSTHPENNPNNKELNTIIKREIEQLEHQKTWSGEKIFAVIHLIPFYQQREFQPAWVDKKGPLPVLDDLMTALNEADREGLNPKDYHLDRIVALQEKVLKRKDPELLVELDLLLTDAYMMYAFHLFHGKVCPENAIPDWYAWCKETEIVYATYLQRALEGDKIFRSFQDLMPRHPAYINLKSALNQYREYSELLTISKPSNYWIKNSVTYASVAQRLTIYGDLQANSSLDSTTIIGALHKFQKRHGLPVSEEVDDETLWQLQTPLDERIRTIKVNMDRWRWLPENLGEKHILVNIAGFNLELVEKNKTVFSTSAIVGKEYTKTPVFSAEMSHIILSPYWVIPRSIVTNEILVKGPATPDYLKRNDIKLLTGKEEVPYDSIDWEAVINTGFPYILRQEPGPGNPLGRIKFIFDNPFQVYIHDTPGQSLFEKRKRAFSHGCIRIRDPFALASLLLRDTGKWGEGNLKKIQAESQDFTIWLPEPIPVHVLYWTSWVDDEGTVHFRDDVYQRDSRVWKALQEKPEFHQPE